MKTPVNFNIEFPELFLNDKAVFITLDSLKVFELEGKLKVIFGILGFNVPASIVTNREILDINKPADISELGILDINKIEISNDKKQICFSDLVLKETKTIGSVEAENFELHLEFEQQ